MREIKFRAWDRRKKQFDTCRNGEYSISFSIDWKGIQELTRKSYKMYSQYTGLKDKNGKEIYEGDIVYMEFEASDNETVIANETNVVIYEEAIASFVFAPSTKHRGLTVRDFWRRYKDCKNVCFREIIGNIYKNPELLK